MAIQDNNLLYNILCPLVQFGTRCHYNSFVVHGIENLPSDGAYIIAPCHQQALMEPLAVLCFAPKPPVFLARADIFSKPTLRAILTFLRILPVYRIRDGKSNLGRNQAIFDQSRDVLLDGYPLCLMAEGRHNNRHRLLPMGKGMFRIAGETQQRLGDHPLYIVPTGIDFDDYERPYSNLVVNIGRPIPVQPFMEAYRIDEPVALNQMRDALALALMPLMHDIRDEEHYDQIITICNVLNREMRRREGLKNTPWNRFLMRQRLSTVQHSPRALQLADTLGSLCRQRHLNPRLLSEHWNLPATLLAFLALAGSLAAAILLPPLRWVLLFLLLCYPFPFIPTHLLVRKFVADPQFRSSFNFGLRFFPSILYAILIAILMACGLGECFISHIIHHTSYISHLTPLFALLWAHIGARLAAPAVTLLRGTFDNGRYWLLRLSGRLCQADKLYRDLKDDVFKTN